MERRCREKAGGVSCIKSSKTSSHLGIVVGLALVPEPLATQAVMITEAIAVGRLGQVDIG